jgi:hypothetical protein
MKSLATKTKSSTSGTKKTGTQRTSPVRPMNAATRAQIRDILRPHGLQTKLIIGRQGDRYEQEADAIADRVVAGLPIPQISTLIPGGLQTQPIEEEEELLQPRLQRQPLDEEEEEELQASIGSPTNSSQTLPTSVRNFYESRFGHNFNHIRIHTDSNAAEMSRELGAQAFTHGRDLYFGAGRYSPDSPSGKKLLAHELTHTIQQRKNWQMPLPPGSHMVRGDHRIQREISTPLGPDVKVDKEKSAKFKVGNVDVIVKHDTRTKDKKMKDHAKTRFRFGGTPSYEFKKGKITKITGPSPNKITIYTVYGPGVTAKSQSGYGKGTTKADKKASKTTLGYHEGSHGADYLQYLRNNPPPQFKGKVGMTVKNYKKAEKAFEKQMKDYNNKMEKHSKKRTDCVGTAADFCSE